jgi:hypothetical protein
MRKAASAIKPTIRFEERRVQEVDEAEQKKLSAEDLSSEDVQLMHTYHYVVAGCMHEWLSGGHELRTPT